MRLQSDRGLHNGGWLHWLAEQPPRSLPPPRPPPTHPPGIDAEGRWRAWRASTDASRLAAHAEALGVSRASLERLGAAWAPPHLAWAFPMRDGAGAIFGIRLRAGDGRKWAVRGSRAGLIHDPDLSGSGPLLVCEGPTDTAAAMTLGFPAVGRPSCRGQEDLLRRLLKTWRDDVVIAADHDPPHEHPDGSPWRPGLAGAVDLAKDLGKPLRAFLPPCKDIREWTRRGATRADVEALIHEARWLNAR